MNKIVIIGGVAGGMAAAARIRRLSEDVQITVIEKGEYISYASCGLPYHVGNTIKDRDKLFVKTPEEMSKLFNLDIKVKTEALSINRESKLVEVKNLVTGELSQISYDKLIMATGSRPFVPNTPGIDNDKIFTLKNVNDMDLIIHYINEKQPANAVVIGGGFIGLEMVEALKNRDMKVSLIELGSQVMPPIDPEMATYIHQDLSLRGIKLYLNNSVIKFEANKESLNLFLQDETVIEADLVILAIGVIPESTLAVDAKLETGIRGSIKVDSNMKTSDKDIYAVGDAIQIQDYVTGSGALIPLAGPANRQGRIVAENLFGSKRQYKNTLGTSICKVFDLTVATTGVNQKMLDKSSKEYNVVYVHPFSHASYYPDAFPMTLKLLFSKETGKIYGAQIIGCDGIDKRIDTLATAIYSGLTIYDLENLELAYAPPYNSVKDPVNVAGNIAVNLTEDRMIQTMPSMVDNIDLNNTILLSVGTVEEFENYHIKGSINIPVDDLRDRWKELDKNKHIVTYCALGMRGYIASRFLLLKGFSVSNLAGGVKSYKAYKGIKDFDSIIFTEPFCPTNTTQVHKSEDVMEIDACGLQCPGPIMKLKETVDSLKVDETVTIIATDPGFTADVKAWCKRTGNNLVSLDHEKGKIIAKIQKLSSELSVVPSHDKHCSKNDKTIVVFSNDLDKVMAAFIIANGAAAMGDKVTLFFTFWGLNVLRKDFYVPAKKSFLDKMFGMMMPRGANKLALSKMHMLGMGTEMMKYVMKSKNVLSLPQLIELAIKNNIRLAACTMSMDVMGITKEELIDGVDDTGVAGFLDAANDSNVNLFI